MRRKILALATALAALVGAFALGRITAPEPCATISTMHYRNGREAKNGDKIISLEGGKVTAVGVLHSAVPGNDYCNGYIAPTQQPSAIACLVDCLHTDDLAAILAERGLDKRPADK